MEKDVSRSTLTNQPLLRPTPQRGPIMNPQANVIPSTSFFFIFTAFAITAASAQPSLIAQQGQEATGPASPTSSRSSLAVVIGVFSIMFSLTFLLLMYAKFCHHAAYELFNRDPNRLPGGSFAPHHGPTNANGRTASGIDKAVIESLPFFRFSSLKGSRDGLECAVCLSKFDDAELLRLLPKCKHAFHIACVDRWLESHSTCPLCRCRIDPRDDSLFKYSNSSRLLFRDQLQLHHSDSSRDHNELEMEELEIELFIEREPGEDRRGLSSRSLRFGSNKKKKADEVLIIEEEEDNCSDHQFLHKFKHRIIVSDVVFKSRWSDFNSSDLVSLSSDMLNVVSSKRFTSPTAVGSESQNTPVVDDNVVKIKEEMERKGLVDRKAREISRPSSATPTRSLISPGNRCMSEITNVSRFPGAKNASNLAADEKVRRLWLPIARRTVQWFAGRERRPEFQHNNREDNSNV